MRTSHLSASIAVLTLTGCTELLADFTFYTDATLDSGQVSDSGAPDSADGGIDAQTPMPDAGCTCEEPTPFCTGSGCAECLTDADCRDDDPCTRETCDTGMCRQEVNDHCIVELSAGAYHTCIRRLSGAVACWGRNADGQVGNGTTIDPQVTPAAIAGLTDAIELGPGGGHTCIARSTRSVLCFGANADGQLGDGTTDGSADPVEVTDLRDATSVSSGTRHTCALRATGALACWGDNSSGQLGNSDQGTDSSVPVAVDGILDAVEVAVGNLHSCARRAGGSVRCWGSNSAGQIGDGTEAFFRSAPVPVVGLGDANLLVAGGGHTCARRAAGNVVCWGGNSSGQLGDGGTTMSTSPVEVADLTDVLAMTAGAAHTCALLTSGDVMCWGSNDAGQLGDGTMDNRFVPTVVPGLDRIIEIDAGERHTCARRETGEIFCWGDNTSGQLGDGTLEARPTPTEVVVGM